MRVYLAHNFAARQVLAQVVIPFLEEHGHTVTSTWITDDSHIEHENQEKSAVVDLEDIERAGALIFFAGQYGSRPGQGKYVELGYAIRAGKIVIVVGEGSCVFYHLCTIRHAKTIEEVLPYLGGSQKDTLQKGA